MSCCEDRVRLRITRIRDGFYQERRLSFGGTNFSNVTYKLGDNNGLKCDQKLLTISLVPISKRLATTADEAKKKRLNGWEGCIPKREDFIC